MKFNKIKNKIRLSNLSYRKSKSLIPAKPTQVDENFLNGKNVIISGEFFPTSEKVFKESLLKRKANVQPQMTPQTEVLICGKYPDWVLVEEARIYGVKIIFVDKAGELFSRLATNLNKNRAFFYEEPLGV